MPVPKGFKRSPIHKRVDGTLFTRLTALYRDFSEPDYQRRVQYVCRCTCGTIKTIPYAALKDGRVKSCGCLRRDRYASWQKARSQNVVVGRKNNYRRRAPGAPMPKRGTPIPTPPKREPWRHMMARVRRDLEDLQRDLES